MFIIFLLIVPLLANGNDRYQSSAQVGHPEMNNPKLATLMKIGHLWNKELIRKLEDQLKSGELSENPMQMIDFLSGVVGMECRIIMEDKQNTPENNEKDDKIMELKEEMINNLCKNRNFENIDVKEYVEKVSNVLMEEGSKVVAKLERIEGSIPINIGKYVQGANQHQGWAESLPEWAEQHQKWVVQQPEWAKFQNLLSMVEAHIKPVEGKEIIQRLLNRHGEVIKPSELIKFDMELWAGLALPMISTAMPVRQIRGTVGHAKHGRRRRRGGGLCGPCAGPSPRPRFPLANALFLYVIILIGTSLFLAFVKFIIESLFVVIDEWATLFVLATVFFLLLLLDPRGKKFIYGGDDCC